MDSVNISIGELTKNFRVCFDKAGLTMYVVPREDAAPLIMGRAYTFSNEDVQPYGTKILLHLPCSGAIYGRYLVQDGDYVSGLYAVITDGDCRVGVSWREEGIDTEIHVRHGEALLIMVRLMRLGVRRTRPDNQALRIMRVLEFSGKLLYADANHEVQVFGIVRGHIPQSQGECVNEFSAGLWKFVFGRCGYVVEALNDGYIKALLIWGVDSITINRYYPLLNKWYELGRASGFNYYLIVLKGEA